jgi:hypothetical protein
MVSPVLVGVRTDLPTPTVGASRVRSVTQQILSQAQFRPPKRTPLQAAWHWLTTELGKLLDRVLGLTGPSGSTIASILAVVLVAAAVAVLVWSMVRSNRRRGGRIRPPGVVLTSGSPSRSPAEWRAEAAAHAAAGRWRDALRCRYRALVAELAGRGLIEEIPGRTSGEYRQDVAAVVPAAGSAFDGATELFEQAWYGDIATGPDEQDRFDALARRVLTPVGGGQSWDVGGPQP